MSNLGEPFQYNSLDDSSIRLLRLLKSEHGPICCELFHVSLQDSLQYEALSYAWGSNELVEQIQVAKATLWITDNLHTALQNLRWADADRVLWIDAVCINQEDTAERTRQVRFMSKIYSCANRVIFWLGKPTAGAITLMTDLQQLQKSLSKEGAVPNSWDNDWTKLINPHLQPKELLDRWSPGLRSLLSRAWFERVWALQEVAKAQDAIVCTGKYSILAYIFAFAASLLSLPSDMKCLPVLDIMPGPTRTDSWLRREQDLGHCLIQFKTSKASDERDKVYALLGIASGPITETVDPDYDKAIEDVLRDCVRSLLSSTDIAIYELLNFLANFQTLNALCVIWPESSESPLELLDCSTRRGKEVQAGEYISDAKSRQFVVARNAVSILPGRRSDDSSHIANACYKEVLDILDQRKGPSWTNEKLTFQPASWGSIEQNVKLLVIQKTDTALMDACQYGYEHIVKLLLAKEDSGNDTLTGVSTRDEQGCTPIHWAAQSGQIGVLRLVLKLGEAEVNTKDDRGWTPLHWAVQNDHEELVKLLLDMGGTDVSNQDNEGWTPLHLAASRGHKELVKDLLKSGKAEIHTQSRDGSTPLLSAARLGHKAIVKLLLEAGEPEANTKDIMRWGPLHQGVGNDIER